MSQNIIPLTNDSLRYDKAVHALWSQIPKVLSNHNSVRLFQVFIKAHRASQFFLFVLTSLQFSLLRNVFEYYIPELVIAYLKNIYHVVVGTGEGA